MPNLLAAYIRDSRTLVLQPRMGFTRPHAMANGLQAIADADPATVGTITIDSYTRVGNTRAAENAVRHGIELNGYPLLAHGPSVTTNILETVGHGAGFPIQVRHGSPRPGALFDALAHTAIDATEGGPVSYCLPYGRTPLSTSVAAWKAAIRVLVSSSTDWHLETFAGCMLGQLCPPDLLAALSVLEAMFFREQGLSSVSLSLTQQTSPTQDVAALLALHRLARERLPDCDYHVVFYTAMGLFPRTHAGAQALLRESVEVAVAGGASRLIVKTASEAHQIPPGLANVEAIGHARQHYDAIPDEAREPSAPSRREAGRLWASANHIVSAVLKGRRNVSEALLSGFADGVLDVPYCLHPDNARISRSTVDSRGFTSWTNKGSVPSLLDCADYPPPTASSVPRLLQMLDHNRSRFDRENA